MMERLYEGLTAALTDRGGNARVEWRTYAGHRFLYVTSTDALSDLLAVIQREAEALIKGTRIRYRCDYVRSEEKRFVFRFRFLVPQEKMFCCGNQCADCTLRSGR
ncbi:hypothetical protein [Brevibacillus marinus]|uniref:hypothetical protein n=1 Tax=Brevibacillus marinus TaxID=2496837 RepID=UPI000F8367FA|nr:hypothetical protein [Brevibacillus marinus]